MFKIKLQSIFIIFIVPFFLTSCSLNNSDNVLDKKELNKNQSPAIASNDMFYADINFKTSVNNAQVTLAQDNIAAVIVPHHLVASDYIAILLKMASGRNIKKVIIVGPNHDNIGVQAIASASVNWQTPFGIMQSDQNIVQKFLSDLNLKDNPDIFPTEHSIGAEVPFVKYFFPEVKILPIVISSYAAWNDVEKVSQWLAKNIDSETLIIFSIDFSHYLEKSTADKKDEITRQLILDKDIAKILELNNDNVDSPATLATALELAKIKNWSTNIIYNGNSFDFLNIKPSETTSYFAINFIY